jgi:hypothetical protein
MNIFYLDNNATACAKAHYDKHVVKMILEYAQLLSTAHRVLDGEVWTDLTANKRRITRYRLTPDKEGVLYKATHVNHPSAIWVRESKANYNWLFSLFEKLLEEYTYRYGKFHKTGELSASLKVAPVNIPNVGTTEMPQAMPDECKLPNSIDAYRNYYLTAKKSMLSYTKRNAPMWATLETK